MKQRSIAIAVLTLILSTAAIAADKAPANAAASPKPESEINAAFAAARKTMSNGPAEIPLLDQAALHLPAGFVFVPKVEAGRILSAMGNRAGDNLLGMIFPATDGDWFVVARFENAGYIKDDDAKDWKADELLQNLKDGTEATNAERRTRGIPEIEVVGWVEAPHYDAAAHRLVWSLSSRDKGATADAAQGVNYNTYALGRDGYISMNLVTALSTVESEKPIAQRLLASLDFNSGKRYADFAPGKDRMAEYGLAALVGGIAAKKLGLLAVMAAFFAKFFKIIAVAVAGFGATIAKFWRRK